MHRPNDSKGDPWRRAMQARARKLVQRRFAQIPAARQLQAIILAVTGEVHDLPSPGASTRHAAPVARHVIERLERALTRERGKARCGHRSYDFNRHIALHQALSALKAMASPGRQPEPQRKKPAR